VREICTYSRARSWSSSISIRHGDSTETLTSEQHSPVFLNIRKDRKFSLSLNDVVTWCLIDVGRGLNAVAYKALLFEVLVRGRHVDFLCANRS
jgi:hypothetical protein